ncbi:YdgA family protein [bacterium]|nr:MAG: YdgA family protein [bacterium]
MKKALAALLILILAAALVVAYQWRRAADRLGMAARGGTYRSLGIKLEIAPARGGVQGMFRLKPYVEIPQVVLDLSAWGLSGPIPLGSARLSTQLWRSAGLLLVLEPGGVQRDGFEAKRLAFELALPDLILGLRSEAIVFRDPGAGETLTLQEPWLRLGSREVPVPGNLHLRIEGVTYAKEREGRSPQEIRLGAVESGYATELSSGERRWNFFHRGQGGGYLLPEGKGEIGAWSLQAEGRFADLPWVRWKSLGAEWARLLGALPLPESPPSPETQPAYDAMLDKTAAFLLDLSPRLERMEFRWAGLKVGDEAKRARFSIEPVEFEARYSEDAQGLATEAKGSLKRIEAAFEENRFELSELSFGQKGRLKGVTYRDWLRYFVDYYSATLALSRDPQDWPSRMGALYGAYLAQMPDELSGEIRLGKVSYQGPRYRTEHRGASFVYTMAEDAWSYRLKDDFDSVLPLEPDKSIHQGKVDLDTGFQLPWGELLRYLRQRHRTPPPESLPNLAQVLAGRPAGLDWKWRVDLGATLFALQLDFKLSGDAGKLADMAAMATGMPARDLESAAPKLAQDALRAFLTEGKADFRIQIDRLSRLQAALDKLYSGASMGLAILGPYVEVDAKSDAMKSRLQVEGGQVLLNGRKNSAIESLLRQGFR